MIVHHLQTSSCKNNVHIISWLKKKKKLTEQGCDQSETGVIVRPWFCLLTFAEGSWGLVLITNSLQVNRRNVLILTHSKHMVLQKIRFHNIDTWVISFLTKLTCDKNIHAVK